MMFVAHVHMQEHTHCFLSSVREALLFSARFVGEETETHTILFFHLKFRSAVCSLRWLWAILLALSSR